MIESANCFVKKGEKPANPEVIGGHNALLS
jgi:hypothetical protein